MILLTGFGPYSNYENNISSEIVESLEIASLNLNIKKLILPVSWHFSVKKYKETLYNLSVPPDFVILLGIHPNRHYTIESHALNFTFGKDIVKRIKFGLIRYKLNLRLQTTFNLGKLISFLGHKTRVKQSVFPGFYLCNYIYYWALLLSQEEYPVLFIHIPHKELLSRGIDMISKIIKIITLYYDQLV